MLQVVLIHKHSLKSIVFILAVYSDGILEYNNHSRWFDTGALCLCNYSLLVLCLLP